jgi:hypothetical protein
MNRIDPRNPAAVMAAFEADQPPITPEAASLIKRSLDASKTLGWTGRAASEAKLVSDSEWVFWHEMLNRSALIFDKDKAWLATADQMDAVRAMNHIKTHGSIDYPDSPVFGFGRSAMTTCQVGGRAYGLLELPLSFAGELLAKMGAQGAYVYTIEDKGKEVTDMAAARVMTVPASKAITSLEEAIQKFSTDFGSLAKSI